MNINVIMDHIVCLPCYASLQHHFNFISHCLHVEEKISDYCKVEGTNCKEQMELSSVVHFTSEYELQSNLCDVKGGKEIFEQMENGDFKIETKSEDSVDSEDQQLDIEMDIKIETNQDDSDTFQDNLFHQQQSTAEIPVITGKEDSGMKRYTCEICTYHTKYKANLHRHLLTHTQQSTLETTVFKCEVCRKDILKQQLVTCKSTSEMAEYKCEMCSYQTKYKYNFQRHTLSQTHRYTSKPAMNICEACESRPHHTDIPEPQVLNHKTSTDLTIYKCKKCAYCTSDNRNLQLHKLTHSRTLETKSYKCKICPLQMNHKTSLLRHMLTHKCTSELTVYKCDFCEYQAIHKDGVQSHLLIHKSPSEVTMHKCAMCKFQTKHKRSLQEHLRTHKSTEGLTMYKCELCKYQTKRKSDLKRHMIVHKSTSEVKMHKCTLCKFQTKHKTYLKQHMETHN